MFHDSQNKKIFRFVFGLRFDWGNYLWQWTRVKWKFQQKEGKNLFVM